LHVAPARSFFEKKVRDSGIELKITNFFEIIKGKEHHINNFFHDILGIPYLLNIDQFAKDPEGYLVGATKVKDHGMGWPGPQI